MGCFSIVIGAFAILCLIIIFGIGIGLSVALGILAAIISAKGNKRVNGWGVGTAGVVFTLTFLLCYVHNMDKPLNHDICVGDTWFCRLDKSYALEYIDVPPFYISGNHVNIRDVDSLAQRDSLVFGVYNSDKYFYLNTESETLIDEVESFDELPLPSVCKRTDLQSAQYFYDHYKGPYREPHFDTWPEFSYSLYSMLVYLAIYYGIVWMVRKRKEEKQASEATE